MRFLCIKQNSCFHLHFQLKQIINSCLTEFCESCPQKLKIKKPICMNAWLNDYTSDGFESQSQLIYFSLQPWWEVTVQYNCFLSFFVWLRGFYQTGNFVNAYTRLLRFLLYIVTIFIWWTHYLSIMSFHKLPRPLAKSSSSFLFGGSTQVTIMD